MANEQEQIQDGPERAAAPAPGVEAPSADPHSVAPTVEGLTQALEESRQQADSYRNDMLRAKAEQENFRKRMAREVENAHRYALERFLTELLPVKDSLELGLSAAESAQDVGSVREGVDLTLKMLGTALEKFGVAEIDPAGQAFNPDLHQAISMEDSDRAEPGTVTTVVQKGYLLNDRLIRPAMVIVARRRDGGSP